MRVAGITFKDKDGVQIAEGDYMAGILLPVVVIQSRQKPPWCFAGNINQSVETLVKTSHSAGAVP